MNGSSLSARRPWALILLVVLAPACRVLGDGPRHPIVSVPEAASAAFQEARLNLARLSGLGPGQAPLLRGQARRLAERARDLAPDWAAPRRFLDDMARADLLGPGALAAHLARLEENPADALHLYLAGRMEGNGERALEHMRDAATADADLAWGHHGLSWIARRQGRWDAAELYARRALARARDPYERALFTEMVARALAGGDERQEAEELLAAHLRGGGVVEPERSRMAVLAVQLGARAEEPLLQERAWKNGCALLADGNLVASELVSLTRTLATLRLEIALKRSPAAGPSLEATATELRTALAVGRARAGSERSGPGDALLAELLLEERPTPLALDLLEASGARATAALLRSARFAAGRPVQAMDGWLADLPRQVLDARGLPLDPTLAQLARSVARGAGHLSLGRSCLEVGWFDETRALAGLVGADGAGNSSAALEEALRLDAAADAGRFALDEVGRTLKRMEQGEGEARAGPGASGAGADETTGRAGKRAPGGFDLESALAVEDAPGSAREAEGLGDFLRRLAPAFSVWETLRGRGPTSVEEVREDLQNSPLVSFSGIGEVVHCGPLYSERDQAAGRGETGAPVPGLAAAFASMGRFGLFGTHAMDPVPDGVVLPVVLAEFRRGSLLGVPWSGTVVWCEGADLAPRAARGGARITGSALHEGYWVDLEALRGEREDWQRLARRFSGPTGHARLLRALATRGLDLSHLPSAEIRRRRVEPQPILGEGERVCLAVLAERNGLAESLDGDAGMLELTSVSLTELAATTARHEEGHLCDQSRFLPLSEHKAKALSFFMQCGFSPGAVMRRLEYRAQLTALCVDADPRLPLAQILRTADLSGLGRSILPHGTAYAELLRDLIDELDRNLQSDPGAWPEIHPTRTLVHQLHHLSSDQVRDLARALARDEGLIGA